MTKSEIEMQCVLSTFNRGHKSLRSLYRTASKDSATTTTTITLNRNIHSSREPMSGNSNSYKKICELYQMFAGKERDRIKAAVYHVQVVSGRTVSTSKQHVYLIPTFQLIFQFSNGWFVLHVSMSILLSWWVCICVCFHCLLSKFILHARKLSIDNKFFDECETRSTS